MKTAKSLVDNLLSEADIRPEVKRKLTSISNELTMCKARLKDAYDSDSPLFLSFDELIQQVKDVNKQVR